MYPLDVTMPQAGCCVAGGLEFGAGIDSQIGIGAEAPACPRRQACSCPSHTRCQACVELCLLGREGSMLFFAFFFVWKEKSLHAHRCQSYQQPERQIKQTTEECRVHSTSYDKGSCSAMA